MQNLTYKAVENSKNTSGESGNNPAGGNGQLTSAQVTQLVNLAAAMGNTHFLNHFFMDTNAQMQANYGAYSANYNLRTLEADTQLWTDAVRAAGMKNVYRGTWSGIKGNNDFSFVKYGTGTFIPLGTVAGAASEGETTYCGKLWRFMNVNIGASRLQDGDIIAPISEATEFLSNSNYIWFDTSAGVTAGFYNFFMTLKDVVDAYGASIGKTLKFFTIINYSEYYNNPGHYLDATLPNDSGFTAVDYYGHNKSTINGAEAYPANYVIDWNDLYKEVGVGVPIFQTEMGGIFGDSWPTIGASPALKSPKITTYEDSAHYQIQLWKAYRDHLVNTGKMNGVSNWGFWSGQNSSIVFYSGGLYQLNYFGQIYAAFIKGDGLDRIPVAETPTTLLNATGNRSIHF